MSKDDPDHFPVRRPDLLSASLSDIFSIGGDQQDVSQRWLQEG